MSPNPKLDNAIVVETLRAAEARHGIGTRRILVSCHSGHTILHKEGFQEPVSDTSSMMEMIRDT